MQFSFISPIDGDVLFSTADGTVENGSLKTTITVAAPPNQTITINEQPTVFQNSTYTATIFLDAYRNAVEAYCQETDETITMYIYWFKKGYQTYRLGVDDVIMCFENIYKHQDEYASIFDDPFLAVYKRLHETYGTYVHMHIYYETVDKSFNLSMFPDKYKKEFQANGNWLKFTFHSRCDQPDSPYKYASYDLVLKEGRMVEKEIRRFAGCEVMSNVTSQHWADSNLHATRAFRSLGFQVIDAYFLFDENGDPYVSYYLNREQTAHAKTRDFWIDTKEDIIFVKDDIVINEVALDQIDAYMDNLKAQPDNAFMYLLIHEQYFYKDYPAYQPDYEQKIRKTLSWCQKNGYKPTTISSFAFEERLVESNCDEH